MTARPASEAERLRRCRETFELAMREGVPMSVASQRLAERRWAESEKRLAEKRCGTHASAAPPPRPHFWYDDL